MGLAARYVTGVGKVVAGEEILITGITSCRQMFIRMRMRREEKEGER